MIGPQVTPAAVNRREAASKAIAMNHPPTLHQLRYEILWSRDAPQIDEACTDVYIAPEEDSTLSKRRAPMDAVPQPRDCPTS